ncbi:SbcC/MukB-like Walker B domain-containing protein [Streptomyces sp. HUCO-GS316]|uniref:SbcC/MukB-like Walker B domain-containing protein n=1 Tax=Streptomyces sp. HUCO-GS316 TaxID=2692198 RepID=UPI001F24D3C1|nr:SbcC/MukB-like Walker B domain-containing protein [Streptomyces sp. HUCO-GS316]
MTKPIEAPPARKAPTGLAQARERLRQSADAWAPEDRAAVGEFLQAEIARRQSDDAAGSWLEVLTAALDYRSWHEFGIERHQHGSWVPATGPASGGERVLAVSVPLFAAASSHYATAAPDAPRLVTLDEAFAGVDDDSRAKCLGHPAPRPSEQMPSPRAPPVTVGPRRPRACCSRRYVNYRVGRLPYGRAGGVVCAVPGGHLN